MRYSSHPPRAFRNRIARYLGLLVAAALIATLGLPSAAQAQTIPATATGGTGGDQHGIVYTDADDFTVNWMPSTRLSLTDLDNWIVTLTKPNGEKVVVDQHTTNPEGTTLGDTQTRSFNYNRNDAGTWWFQVDACFAVVEEGDACPAASLEEGTAVGYTHGPFSAPENLAASPIPTGVALTWTSEKSDHGFVDYQYSMNADAAKPKWEPADASGIQPVTAEDGEYTFSVRARGESDNDRNTMEGAAGAAESMGMVASVMITVGDVEEEEGEPVPTLPEIAALFLGMLLLGSGAYLIRGRRQSGGLTNA